MEPWTEADALETVRKLDRWWHRRELDGQQASAEAEGSFCCILPSHTGSKFC